MTRGLAHLLFLAGLAPAFAAAGDTIVIPGRFDVLTTDEFGHVYALQGDVLDLYDAQGKLLARNSVKTFGRISVIDAFYSLKPMVFSSEQGQLAMLDNTLSLQGSVVNLPRNGFPQVTLVCTGVQNYFWFFDQRDMALLRVDPQLRVLSHSGRLDQLLGFTPHPVQIHEHNSLLYVNDPDQGVLVFDLFAAYMRTLPVKGAQRIEVRDNNLFFLRDGELSAYDLLSFEVRTLHKGGPGVVLDARIERGVAYLRLEDRILIVPARAQ